MLTLEKGSHFNRYHFEVPHKISQLKVLLSGWPIARLHLEDEHWQGHTHSGKGKILSCTGSSAKLWPMYGIRPASNMKAKFRLLDFILSDPFPKLTRLPNFSARSDKNKQVYFEQHSSRKRHWLFIKIINRYTLNYFDNSPCLGLCSFAAFSFSLLKFFSHLPPTYEPQSLHVWFETANKELSITLQQLSNWNDISKAPKICWPPALTLNSRGLRARRLSTDNYHST